jgi:hypothetical protein
VLPQRTLVYNARPGLHGEGPLHDPTAILYLRASHLDPTTGKLLAGRVAEPLVLRAKPGECIEVTLINRLPIEAALPDLDGFSTLPMIVEHFNANQVKPSSHVGLHAQLVSFEASDDGSNVGFNPVETAPPGGLVKYEWYAGTVSATPFGFYMALPIEFGAANLIPSDPIKHSNKGAIGGLIIEPRFATWLEDPGSRASATVTLRKSNGTPLTNPDGSNRIFREFVVLLQNDVNLRNDHGAVPNTADAEDAEDSGQKAVNYRTEPMWKRLGFAPDATLESTRTLDFSNALSNALVGGDPVTPVFSASAGTPVRFRVLHPGGHQRNNVFMVHGHVWQEQPYVKSSTEIGSNPLSEWKGSQHGIGPGEHFDLVLENGAGGKFGVEGDYLWRDFQSFQFDGGLWGLLRVTPVTP